MAKVLITGIAGFVGSNLARGLLAEGADVRGIDNLITGKEENIEQVRDRIEFRHADITDLASIQAACEGIDFVFHLAALPSVPRSVADPIASHHPNINGTLNVLEAARRTGVKRVIYAGSSSAYGADTRLPKVETMRPDPISAYAVQKLTGELYMTSFFRMYGLETIALRYFNVFGPRQNPHSQYSGVLAKFIAQSLRGETPSVFGDGQTSRDFTFIENVVSANMLAARAGPDAVGKVYNVAAGNRVSLLEALQAIRKIVGVTGEIHFLPPRVGDTRHSLADISQAERFLGYKVRVPFFEGLEHTVAWYRQELGL